MIEISRSISAVIIILIDKTDKNGSEYFQRETPEKIFAPGMGVRMPGGIIRVTDSESNKIYQ
jgi:hypothetical protein